MENKSLKINTSLGVILLMFLILIINTIQYTFAEVATITTATSAKVEISLPIQKSDFLLFYGVTQDKVTDAKLLDLRKDFTKKFEALKKDYETSFNTIVGDKELSPIVSLDKDDAEIKTAPQTMSLKSVKIDTKVEAINTPETTNASNLETKTSNDIAVASSIDNVKPTQQVKYVLTDIKDGIIAPLVNIINDTPNIKIESSSWFQKIKSWFGW